MLNNLAAFGLYLVLSFLLSASFVRFAPAEKQVLAIRRHPLLFPLHPIWLLLEFVRNALRKLFYSTRDTTLYVFQKLSGKRVFRKRRRPYYY